jgi:hypothetical protein
VVDLLNLVGVFLLSALVEKLALVIELEAVVRKQQKLGVLELLTKMAPLLVIVP